MPLLALYLNCSSKKIYQIVSLITESIETKASMYTLTAYLAYLGLSVFTVFYVGKKLHNNGRAYLFGECPDEALSTSANNFLYVCYCLLNVAFALFFLQSTHKLVSLAEVVEFLAETQGIICISQGVLHILNVLFAPRIINLLLNKKLLTNKK